MKTIVDHSEVGSAVFSPDRRRRYRLTRWFEAGTGTCCFMLLNPSRADSSKDDSTVSRCSGFVRRWGYREMQVVNLFSLMTPDPRVLARSDQPGSPADDQFLLETAAAAGLVVAAWGVHGALLNRSSQVRSLLRRACIPVSAFGITKNGEPRHPLYLPYSSPLSSFSL